MTDLPAPLSLPHVDLRGYEFMPLFGSRLFGSAAYTKALRNPRAGMAMLKLWWVAWQQCPAGSLPHDDDALCHLADFGVDMKAWLAVKALALHGFVLCSDDRLYHKMLCEQAEIAYARRVRERTRKADLRARKAAGTSASPPADVAPSDRGRSAGSDADVPRDRTRTSGGSDVGRDADVRSDRRGEDRTGEIQKASPSARQVAAPSPEPVRDVLWRDGIAILRALTGKPDQPCRAFLGKLLKEAGDDAARVLVVLREAASLRPADPGAWLMASVKATEESRAAKREAAAIARSDDQRRAVARVLGMELPDEIGTIEGELVS